MILGDEATPRCNRCQAKNLPCARPAKKTVFRNASMAPFHTNQTWVSGEIKECRLMQDLHIRSLLGYTTVCMNSREDQLDGHAGSASTAGTDATETTSRPRDAGFNQLPSPKSSLTFPASKSSRSIDSQHQARGSPSYQASSWQPGTGRSPPDLTSVSSGHLSNADHPSPPYSQSQHGSNSNALSPLSQPFHGPRESTTFPLKDPQEACLLRYFVEELSHWVRFHR